MPASCDSDIASFYIYDLPDRFNRALLRRCRDLSPYTDMCPTSPAAASASRYRTAPTGSRHTSSSQRCSSTPARAPPLPHFDPDSAALFYIPFYAGLYTSSVFGQRNHTLRDALASTSRSTSPASRRSSTASSPSGAGQRVDPHHRAASVEGKTQFGIPYPSYFHPRSADELTAWQEEVRRAERTHLFAFIGGGAQRGQKEVMRALTLKQCGSSSRCLQLECKQGSGCYTPGRVMDVLMRAEFCLQPQGDTFTRRSVFDSVLAGCVPVFFSEHTAYTQYPWYAPGRAEEWSVFLGPERRGRIEEELSRIPKDAVARMREVVIGMIRASPTRTRTPAGPRGGASATPSTLRSPPSPSVCGTR
uniref:Exostosin GT47 domain-containing protein n=1 Tax=Ananas comosus var. bracteatus TaxID=296719 RepID=A0A6V7QVF2_ANACO